MDPEVDADADGSNEDVDMIAAPALVPASATTSSDKPSNEDQSHGNAEGASPSITMAEAPQLPESVEGHIRSIKACWEDRQSRPLEEGDVGYIVSKKWLHEVIGDERDPKFAKAGLVDPRLIGPVDNSDIIWEVIEDPTVGKTSDPLKRNFVRLKQGISFLVDCDVFPPAAWELLMQWPGLTPGQMPIVRYAHKMSDNEVDANVIWEMNPPVFTIHRLWSANSPIPIKQIIKQKQPIPVRLARSITTSWKQFLSQAKNQADIELKDKVWIWRVPRQLPARAPNASAGPTPPASPDHATDPNNPQDSWPHLLLDVASFLALEKGVERERVTYQDVSANPNYDGHIVLGHPSVGLTTDQTIVLDEQIEGTEHVSTYSPSTTSVERPAPVRSNSSNLEGNKQNRTNSQGPTTRGRVQKSGRQVGCVGLGNLGNTCYMNAALQCLRSVEELTKYFLLDEWSKEINRDNVLGHNGNVAAAYAGLLHEIYKEPTPGSVTPRQFKSTIGRYAPAFSGYGQQDSQEFLGFLLDGLQEDLSRIKKKPYIEKPDSTDDMINNPAAIREMAEKVWDITKKRDDSVIADLFTGLYKSTLVCPDAKCAKVSITFDPFNNLTLPLPVENKWDYVVKFFPLNDRPINIQVEIDKTASFKSLKEFISSRVGVPVARLHGAEEWKGKFYKQYSNDATPSDEITKDDMVWFFELEDTPTNWNSAESKKHENVKKGRTNFRASMVDEAEAPGEEVLEKMLVPVFHRRPASRRGQYSKADWELQVLPPHFIIVDPTESRREDIIRRKILQKVATFSKHKVFSQHEDSDASEATTDPELVGTSGSDFGSSEGKVVAQSVEGEDDIVDVTMKDAEASRTVSCDAQKIQSRSAKYFFNRVAPVWVNPKEHLLPELQNMFDLGFFAEAGSLLANGMNGFDESKEYPKLSSRVPEPTSPLDDPIDNATNGTASNDDSSSEGASRRSADLSNANTRMTEDSEDDDVPAVVKGIPHRPKTNTKVETKTKGSHKKTKRRQVYGKKGKRRDKQMATTRKQQQEFDEAQTTPPECENPLADGGPLIRLREAIVVDWVEGAFEMLFDDGKATFEQCETLADPELEKARQARTKRSKHGITLDNCLDEFERKEVLSEQDTWYCPGCKQHQRATKNLELWKTPDILVVHLKRFSSSGYRRDKIDMLVDCPLENLDLTHRVRNKEDGKEEVYDLIGVDCHWGGLGGGHYTAHAKNFVDGAWYTYNDAQVSRASPSSIVDSSAYLLFYRRRSAVPLGGPRFQVIVEGYDNPRSNDDDAGDAGEGRRLGEGSSQTGSPSAFQEQEAGATHQQTGTAGGSGLYDQSVQPSIESDEAIDMTDNTQSSFLPSWSFARLDGQVANMGSPLGSGAASDEAQLDSSGDERINDFDDTEMSVPGQGQYDLNQDPDGELPAYSDVVPSEYDEAAITRNDMPQIWDQKDKILKVSVDGDDQGSEEAAEIHLDDDDKIKFD